MCKCIDNEKRQVCEAKTDCGTSVWKDLKLRRGFSWASQEMFSGTLLPAPLKTVFEAWSLWDFICEWTNCGDGISPLGDMTTHTLKGCNDRKWKPEKLSNMHETERVERAPGSKCRFDYGADQYCTMKDRQRMAYSVFQVLLVVGEEWLTDPVTANEIVSGDCTLVNCRRSNQWKAKSHFLPKLKLRYRLEWNQPFHMVQVR